jgi:hypothetical protein
MPYFVLIAGVVIIVLIWVSHEQAREQAREHIEQEKNKRELDFTAYHRGKLREQFIWRIIGTGAVVAGMWFWGVESLIEQRQQKAFEQRWLDTFEDEHQREFNSGCEEILARISPITGVAFNRDKRQAVSVLTCRQSWSPPQTPDRFSPSDYDQPGSTPPFPSEAIFGEDLGDVMCADLSDEDSCYTWDDFVYVPPPEISLYD